jgi:hypothetical protein
MWMARFLKKTMKLPSIAETLNVFLPVLSSLPERRLHNTTKGATEFN